MFSFILKVKNFIIKHLYSIFAVILALLFVYPEYIKMQIYPYIFGSPTQEVFEISENDAIENITKDSFRYSLYSEPIILFPRASYSVTALILDLERYDTLFEKFYHGYDKRRMLYNSFAPLDLVLGFGDMANPDILKHYKFEHQWRGSLHMCNPCDGHADKFMNNYHVIPASVGIKKALEMVVKGKTIHLEGYLVDVQAENIPSFKLHTGISHGSFHDDQLLGGRITGMCFILYVTEMILNGRIYR